MSLKLTIALTERVREISDRAVRDRGEGPIPHVVMIAVMAAGAIVIGGLIVAVARGWVGKIPTTP